MTDNNSRKRDKYSNEENQSKGTSCHFEDADGHYEIVNGTWSWNWIHNISASRTGKNCTITDHISALIHNDYNNTKPLHIITLGDSLDKNIVANWICGPGGDAENHGFQILHPRSKEEPGSFPHHYDIDENLFNKAPLRQRSSTICTNGQTTFAYLKIFGMHHCCDNDMSLNETDSRKFNTTKERVEKLLEFEILSRLPRNNSSNFVVMVSSALWDLSSGCNNQLGISNEYRQLYAMGMLNLYEVIRKLLPNAPIYWKTSPAVSVEYDKKSTLLGNGRTRSNQEELNSIMRKTVADHNLGVVMDWWVLANQRPEAERGLNRDGRHYNQNSSIVFYNLFLNALFDHHPYLVQL